MIKYNDKYYITIKELAEYRGVSVQSIYKLLSTSLNQYSTLVENKKMIDISVFKDYYQVDLPSDILNQVENKFNKVENDIKPNSTNSTNFKPELSTTLNSDNENADIVSLLKDQLNDCREQIAFLKDQIAEKDKQINTLHALLNASEELQRNNQILLLHSSQKSNTDDLNASEEHYDNIDDTISNTEEQKPKKGFFSRLFG
jgi:chromosome segregation ATPase